MTFSNHVPPSVTPPSPSEWLETVFAITGITQASQALVSCPGHAFTTTDQDTTSITFKQILGMLPLNGITARISRVLSSTTFSVYVNTTNFPAYQSGGVIVIDTGQPPYETVGFQTFNTPWQNVA